MADKPITTEQFHTELTELLAEVVSKAIRGGSATSGSGLDWSDAERVANLVDRARTIEISTSSREGHNEMTIAVSFGLTDDCFFDGDPSEYDKPLSDLILDDILTSPEYVREQRAYLAASLAKVDQWIAKHPE